MTESQMTSLQRLKTLMINNPEITALSSLLLLYLFLANYFAFYQVFYLPGMPTSGGSDPYYNFRVIQYILDNKHFLIYDAALNYPLGAGNPRNPFFQELIVLVATILSPVYGTMNAALGAFQEYDAVFGALLIIPVYLIGNELFGKKAGMIGAFLYTLMPSNLSAGIISDGREHTPELLWAFFTIYFILKAVDLARKTNVVDSFRHITKIPGNIVQYYRENRIATIYALLAGASTGALMLSWQGFTYIVAIVLIYVFVQLIANIFQNKPSGYLVYVTALYVFVGFLLGAYYYFAMHEATLWYMPPLYLSMAVLIFGLFVSVMRGKPWIIIIPSLMMILLVILGYAYVFDRGILNTLLSGDGYFIKTRVYDTISEAQAPQLGSYISGFGPAQFILGMSGIAYVVYLFLRKRSESLLFILVFSIVSIYMSFAAARFNVTAAPAYAILGGELLIYFWGILREGKVRSTVSQDATGRVRRLMKGNKSWMRTAFIAGLVIVLVIPSGFSSIASAVPANNAAGFNQAIYNELPSFLQPPNFSATNAQFVGGAGFAITNNSQPLSMAFNWLSTQDTNQPMDQRPAYVSWWDYGFQEISQAQHPTVADDFQEGYQAAGQILLAQNNSQDIALFIARVLQAEFKDNNGNLPANILSNMTLYLGENTTVLLENIYADPLQYQYMIYGDPSLYGHFIPGISSQNAYFALYDGILSSRYSNGALVNLYLSLTRASGYNIKYVGIDSGLFPFSGINPGIFYAPTYLTDHVSYTYNGEIVPYSYYNIYAVTSNATYPLNETPNSAAVTSYQISYNPAFYNSSIYRFTIGYPPTATGNTSGIPGLTFGQSTYFMMPAWNMSNFEVSYAGIPWNPYKNFSSHPTAWQIIPLQQAYYYQQKGIGTTEIFPPTYQLTNSLETIVSYYPGAIITGRVTMSNGMPVPGVHVTLLDQYGIPHSQVNTNRYGYYNITAVPGNDTLAFSDGVLNKQFLVGNNSKFFKIHVSNDQAERNAVNLNTTTGLPDFYIVKNYTYPVSSLTGIVQYQYMYEPFNASKKIPQTYTPKVYSGTVQIVNASEGVVFNETFTGGQFKFPDIPPLHYTVNLIVNGKTYVNVANFTENPGLALEETFYIYYDTVFVHVRSASGGNASLISGIKVTAYSGNTSYSNFTNSSGMAILWLLPGSYYVAVNQTGTIASAYTPITFTGYAQNVTANLTATQGYTFSGRVINNWHNSQIMLYPDASASSGIAINVSAAGTFSQLIPAGIYTVYAVHSGNSYLHTMVLDRNTSVDIALSGSSVLTISLGGNATSSTSGDYLIKDGSAILQLPFSYGKSLNITIPDGLVSVELNGISIGQVLTAEKTINLLYNQSVTLFPVQNSYVNVFPFNSMAGSTFNSQTAIHDGIVELFASGTLVWFSPLTPVGTARLSTLNLPYSDLSYSVLAYPFSYYYNNSVDSSSLYAPLSTVTNTLDITLLADNISTHYNGTLNLIGVRNYSVPITNGQASVNAMPGIYSVRISSTEATFVPQTGFAVAYNSSGTTGIAINSSVVLSLTVGSAKGEYVFNSNGNSVNVSRLDPGLYTVYSYSGGTANISNVYLSSNMTYNPYYDSAGSVTLSNSYNASLGTYKLQYNGLTISLPAGTYELPYGEYHASVNYSHQTPNGLYNLVGSAYFNVSGSTGVVIPATLQKVLANVTGKVSSAIYAPYTVLEFFNSTGAFVTRAVTNASGVFSLSLSPATYSVYLINNASDLANVTVFYMTQTNTTLNAAILNANSVEYEVTLQSISLNRQVNISHGNFIMSGYATNNTPTGGVALLPAGIYVFSASYEQTLQYGSHSVNVSYVENYTVKIDSSSFVDIILSKVVLPHFQFKVLSSSGGPVKNGSSENFTFVITNLGNVVMNLTLTSGYGEWNMTFNNSVIKNLLPYQNATRTVQIYVPASGVISGRNTVPINFNYNYSGRTFTGYVNISVVKYLNLSVTPPTFAQQNSTQYMFPFQLNNTGNNELNVTMTTEYSYFKAFGWNASFIFNNASVTKVSIPFNTTYTVNLRLIPVTGNAQIVSTFYAVFKFANQTDNLTVNNPQYPGNHINSGYPTGPGIIANYTGDPITQLYIGIALIAISVIAGLAVAAYRGRKSR